MLKIMREETYNTDLAEEYHRGRRHGEYDERERVKDVLRERKHQAGYKGGNGMGKVELPREVAIALRNIRGIVPTNYDVFHTIRDARFDPDAITIREWAISGDGTRDTIMEALVNGFTIEKSPKERLREYAAEQRAKVRCVEGAEQTASVGKLMGMRATLDILGIKIEGVNAK